MKKLIVIPLLLYFVACQKKATSLSATNTLMTQAKTFFTDSILTGCKAISYRAMQPKTVQWELAQIVPLSTGESVLAPISYAGPMLMKANLVGESWFHLNYLTQLLVYKQPDSATKAFVITYFPDSNFFKNPLGMFTGLKFIEDWQGNPVGKFLYTGNGMVRQYAYITKASASIISTQTCYTISGYNYSSDDPDDGYSWTEDAGCETNYESIASPVLSGSNSNPLTNIKIVAPSIIIPSGNSIIQSVSSYFQCYTNVGGTDHEYNVAICVNQPTPGQRTAWTLAPGGSSGSTAANNLVNVGHTFLILTETYGSTTISRNIGFYPSSSINPNSPSAPGQFNDDDTHPYNISGNFTVTNAQFFDILNFITTANSPDYLYNLNSNNCTTFALNALASAGINLPRTNGTWLGGTGADPGDLGEDIRSGKIAGMTVNLIPGTNNSHANIGQCN